MGQYNWILDLLQLGVLFAIMIEIELLNITGLKLVQQSGYDKVIIQSDSLEVIKTIIGNSFAASNSALIRRIHNILSQENQWFLRYITKEQNQVADCLAKQALIEKDNLQVLDVPPLMARTFIDMNKSIDVSFAQMSLYN
ncbi:hypothetical protein Goshw_010691 [Gossypium schwendimanii]|uniref:RNase H type-1 domain-containing protein n=1 Tax=Gossypium schwendimanii TaxID=34291 RepID=A0A7J9M2D3_GOSSC|nr:hypothetical protein [Gossypium schwendimanii]